MTVLILAPERDFTADRMVKVLEDRDVPVARVDTAWFPQRASIDAELRDGRWVGTLSASGRAIALEGLRSAWYRSPGAFGLPAELSATERNWAMSEAKLGLGGVLASLPVKWINHPSRNADAAYKPVQLVTAARCGLTVTDTLVTNLPDAVRRFAAAGETVTKAFGAAAIIEDGGRKTGSQPRWPVWMDRGCDRGADHRGARRSTREGDRSMTATTAPWRELAHRLADEMMAEDVLRTPAWRDAVEAIPRHLFVPRFYIQQPGGEWIETTAEDDEWLAAVYRNEPLITDLAVAANGNRVTVSSSTKPGLMVRMLEALDVDDEHRVLEIGTGTGYNAGLLSHRLGADRVYSVDIGASLVDTARDRLAELGLAPTLAVAHGAGGMPQHGPFDRIIATCSLPVVPWAWAEQVGEGGLVLVDVKPSVHAGNLVLLTRHADRLEGRFLPRWAGFMAIRDADQAPERVSTIGEVQAGTRSTTHLDPLPWSSLVPWFLAQARLPGELAFGYRGATGQGPEWAVFSARDGSWCAVRMQADDAGEREVRQDGPVKLWNQFETTYKMWDGLGQPSWDRLGLTVTPDGHHRVWLDEPDGDFRWSLPPRA